MRYIISIYPVTPNSGYTDPTNWETTVNAGQGGDYMRVRTQYTFHFLIPLIGNFTGGTPDDPGGSAIQKRAVLK